MVQAPEQRSTRWAPWWLYVIAIVVTNQLRTGWLLPEGMALWLEIAVGLASIALVVAVVTAVWRAVRR
jgi:hypothetical protein